MPWFSQRTHAHRPARRRAHPRLEALEDRSVPAVTATLSNGLLTVTGDDGVNTIIISETATTGQYTVNDGATPVAGSPFTGVNSISVNTRAGVDSVTLNGNAANLTGLAAGAAGAGLLTIAGSGALTVNVGDDVNVQGQTTINHTAATSTDPLNVTITGPDTRLQSLVVNDGDGLSSITVENGTRLSGFASFSLGNGANSVTFQAGAGNTVGATINSFLSYVGGSGDDVLTLADSTVQGNVATALAGGANQTLVRASSVSGSVTHGSTAGTTDTAEVANGSSVRGGFTVNVGTNTGNTTVNVTGNSRVGGALSITGAAGDEAVLIQNAVVGGGTNLNLAGAATQNQLTVTTGVLTGNVIVNSAANLGFTFQTGSQALGFVSINGSGTSAISATVAASSFTGFLSLAGGSGNDNVNVTNVDVGGAFAMAFAAGTSNSLLQGLHAGGNFLASGAGTDHTLSLGADSSVRGTATVNFAGATGTTSTTFNAQVLQGLSFTGGAGNDTVTLDGAELVAGAASLSFASGDATINLNNGSRVAGSLTQTGTGNASLTMNGGSRVDGFVSLNTLGTSALTANVSGGSVGGFFSAVSGSGNDAITLADTSVGGNTAALFADGTNSLTLTNSRLGGSLFTAGTGANTLTATGITIGSTVTATGAAGDDTVSLTDVNVGDDLILTLGTGTNQATASNLTLQGNFSLIAGGTNTVSVTGSTVRNDASVNTTASTTTSTVSFTDALVGGGLNVSTGSGNDGLTLTRATVGGISVLTTLGGGDTITTNGAVFQNTLNIDTGAGADTLNVESGTTSDAADTSFQGNFSFLGGDDADAVNLGLDDDDLAVFFATANFNGGNGTDTLSQAFARFLGGAPSITSF